jgi:hypothetical protein
MGLKDYIKEGVGEIDEGNAGKPVKQKPVGAVDEPPLKQPAKPAPPRETRKR